MQERPVQMGAEHRQGSFCATGWSLVRAAGSGNGQGRRSLDELCRLYWYRLYCYVRLRGYAHAQAEDMVQGYGQALRREIADTVSSESELEEAMAELRAALA